MREFQLAIRVRLDAEALEALDEFRGRPVFLVTDDLLVTAGVYRKAVDRLGERVTTFTGVKLNPNISEVSAGVSIYLQSGLDMIVAYGGGSMIDVVKMMHKAALDADFRALGRIVVILVASGSSSEVTPFTVVTDEQTHTEAPIASSELVAGLAILDPRAVTGVLPYITADSGMNVPTRTTEAYVMLEAYDFSDALAGKAVELAFGNLECYYTHDDDLETRSHMYNVSRMTAMAFDNIGLGIARSLARVLGGHHPITHGRLDALPLPHVIEFSAACSDRAAECYARPSRLLHLSARSRATVISLIGAVKRLRSKLGIPSRLNDLKVTSEILRRDKDDLMTATLASGCTTTTPVAPSPDDLKGILRRIA